MEGWVRVPHLWKRPAGLSLMSEGVRGTSQHNGSAATSRYRTASLLQGSVHFDRRVFGTLKRKEAVATGTKVALPSTLTATIPRLKTTTRVSERQAGIREPGAQQGGGHRQGGYKVAWAFTSQSPSFDIRRAFAILERGEAVATGKVVSGLLRNISINLFGLGATIVGLQVWYPLQQFPAASAIGQTLTTDIQQRRISKDYHALLDGDSQHELNDHPLRQLPCRRRWARWWPKP